MKIIITLLLFTTLGFAQLSISTQTLGNLLESPKSAPIDFKLKKDKPPKKMSATDKVLNGYICDNSQELEAIYIKRNSLGKLRVLKIWVTKKPIRVPIDGKCSLFPICLKDSKKIMKKYNAIIPTKKIAVEIDVHSQKKIFDIEKMDVRSIFLTANQIENLSCLKNKTGIRLVARKVELDGKEMDISNIFRDPGLFYMVFKEGPTKLEELL